MSWEMLITVLGTLGGLEFVKFLVYRKQDGRIKEAQADTDEFHNLKEQIEFLQQQLKEKEERFAEQTNVLRDKNAQILQITDEKNAKILQLTEEKGSLQLDLQKYRCVVPKCQNRDPQNGY
jgi:DNA repair exonuclease SbcCD ATPase subunit